MKEDVVMEISRKDTEVAFFNKKLLKPYEKEHSKYCPEFHLDMEEIKKKLNILYSACKKSKNVRQVTKELEVLIPCIFTSQMLPYLQSLGHAAHPFSQIIIHHVLAKLEHPARAAVLNYKVHEKWHWDNIGTYIDDLLNQGVYPEVTFDLIHEIWKYHPCVEFKLRLLCCRILIKNKHYDKLDQLIRNNVEYFLSSQEHVRKVKATLDTLIYFPAYTLVLLLLLCHYVTSRQKAKVETVLIIIKKNLCEIQPFTTEYLYIREGFIVFIDLALRTKQMIPLLIQVLQPVLDRLEYQYLNLEIISLFNAKLMEVNCHKEAIDVIKDNSHYILSVPLSLKERECYVRKQHCILLMTLLHIYMMNEDLTNMNHVLNRLQIFRKLSSKQDNYSCYCFKGLDHCKPKITEQGVWNMPSMIKHYLFSSIIHDLHKHTKCIAGRSVYDCCKIFPKPIDYSKLTTKVINGELRLIWFLKYMINETQNLHKEFMLFVEKISIQNTTVVYDIIKTLSVLKTRPKIQDILIQGLTEYIHVKFNKQYSILSNLILDINITCHKGEFLQKLTINMGQHLLPIKEDTVEKIIYKCFCIVRHENKVNDDKKVDLEKYKKHFPFLPTMEKEEEMEKLLHLRSFLVMLILLIISSSSKHKSSKLKKYLSLKYAYKDAILYLLWCSGDVEINPGPTLKRLEKKADSVKKRNWIHEMCTKTLKILKNIALDSKSDGMWKEKPDNWQELHRGKLFYDPRNKPKSEQLSIEDDKELMNCLLKCCDGKNIPLPSNFQTEIIAWEEDDLKLLLELCVTRWEIEAMKMAKDLLIKYADTPEFKKYMKDCYVDLSFNPNSTQKDSPKGYSDVVRDLAITFCRVSKGLPIFEKSDGIWKTQPHDWNPNHIYYSPCNTAKRYDKHQDQQLVDNLLSYCEKKSKSIPPELQLVVSPWKLKVKCKLGKSSEICKLEKSHKICKLEKIREICKHYTIWSSMATIQHSIKYLEIEGLLEKPDVQQSLKQIGVSLHCEKGPKHLQCKSTVTTDNESKVSGLPYNPISDNLRDIHSSSPSSSASDSDIVCSQHPYEAKASTNSQTMKSVIKCSKPDFQNHPSTSCCTIYSTLLPCPDSKGDLQYTDESLDIPNSYKSVCEISGQEPDFQPSTSSCTIDSKRAPCQENSVDLQPRDDRDLSDSHKSLPEISCEEPDLQPSTSGCSAFNKRPECQNVRDKVPSTERIQVNFHFNY